MRIYLIVADHHGTGHVASPLGIAPRERFIKGRVCNSVKGTWTLLSSSGRRGPLALLIQAGRALPEGLLPLTRVLWSSAASILSPCLWMSKPVKAVNAIPTPTSKKSNWTKQQGLSCGKTESRCSCRHSEGRGWGGVRKLQPAVLATQDGSPSVTRPSYFIKRSNPASCEMWYFLICKYL